MQQQITRISPFQTAKVIAVLYFVITIPFIILFALFSMFAPNGQKFGIVFIISAPFIYAIVGFIFSIIGAWIYNVVAKFVGGIEFTMTETRDF
jgi:hypothetical protein